MDRTGEYREELKKASENVRALKIEYAHQGKDRAGVDLGIYVIQVIAPSFACGACGKTEPGQPIGLERRADREGAGYPWTNEAVYDFDFAPPIGWDVSIHDPEKTLCMACKNDFERSRSAVFEKFFDVWVAERRREKHE